ALLTLGLDPTLVAQQRQRTLQVSLLEPQGFLDLLGGETGLLAEHRDHLLLDVRELLRGATYPTASGLAPLLGGARSCCAARPTTGGLHGAAERGDHALAGRFDEQVLQVTDESFDSLTDSFFGIHWV